MGRGVSAGGGQSSLGYLFGDNEASKSAVNNALPISQVQSKTDTPKHANITEQGPAGLNNNSANNYKRADGQNAGNFITDRPSTKVHSAPGGGSSLGYLFGGGSN